MPHVVCVHMRTHTHNHPVFVIFAPKGDAPQQSATDRTQPEALPGGRAAADCRDGGRRPWLRHRYQVGAGSQAGPDDGGWHRAQGCLPLLEEIAPANGEVRQSKGAHRDQCCGRVFA